MVESERGSYTLRVGPRQRPFHSCFIGRNSHSSDACLLSAFAFEFIHFVSQWLKTCVLIITSTGWLIFFN